MSTSAVKILHIITGLRTGGAEMMLLKLCTSLDRSRFANHIVSLVHTDGSSVRASLEAADIPVTSLGIRSPARIPRAAVTFARITRQTKPDIIHGWLAHGNLAATMAHLFARRAHLAWNVRQSLDLVSHRDAKTGTSLTIALGARLSRRPEAIVYNSRTARAQHESVGYAPARGITIPNGFDLSIFRPSPADREAVRAELGVPATNLLIGLVARYHPMKDHKNFLTAASRLIAKHADVRFLLAGPGVDTQNAALMHTVETLGLAEHVHLLGERHDTARINAALDIATSASRTIEGFSNAIGEAMAAGVPCVVTDVGDSAHIVGDRGFVVPPEDPAALAAAWEALIAMSREERIALGNEARQRIATHFSVDAIAQQYAELYDRLARR